jgi:Transposase IS4
MVRCKVRFQLTNNEEREAGLVCWKDYNTVYCLSNDTNNHKMDEAHRRGEGGIIRIPCPMAVARYNKYMGGVNLAADMRQLHYNSTIMNQNRWLFLKRFLRRDFERVGSL